MLHEQNSSLPAAALRFIVVIATATLLVGCPSPAQEPASTAIAVIEDTPEAAPATETPEPVPETGTPEAAAETETPEATPEAETPEAADETETPEATDEVETPEATPEAETLEASDEEAQTAGALAQAGQQVYADQCAQCHGAEGEGITAPAVIGERANLESYNTARGLYDYIRTMMPLNAPGSLTEEQYRDVTGFLLIENDYAQEDDELSLDTFEEITLE